MEETQVPFSSDLQREDARFIFDSCTIQRMELLILSTLQWGMRSIMPFSFINYFAYRAIQGHGHGHDATPVKAVMSRAIELILSTREEIDFMEYSPSAIAAAALSCATKEVVPLQAVHYKRALSSSVTDVDKDKMFGCYNLIQETIIEGGCYWTPMSLQATDKTPVGVLDAADCLSNTPTSSYSVKPYASVTAAKRRKLNEICSALTCQANKWAALAHTITTRMLCPKAFSSMKAIDQENYLHGVSNIKPSLFSASPPNCSVGVRHCRQIL